jgi:hypothetical protein
MRVSATAAGTGGKIPVRALPLVWSTISWTLDPRTNCHAIHKNMKSTIAPTTSRMSRRSRAHATAEKVVMK